jgi:hypoxanthine phosphoribosyltransferase
MKILDKEFEIYITQGDMEKNIDRISNQINNDYKDKNPLFLVMLNGAFMFATELLQRINIPCEVSFVKCFSYNGNDRELIGNDFLVCGRDIIIIEDIVDTGATMDWLTKLLNSCSAKSVKIASMLFKPGAFKYDYKIDYIGEEIDNDFVVGYGMDYNGYGRNLTSIYKLCN